jgi:hypothetical protein
MLYLALLALVISNVYFIYRYHKLSKIKKPPIGPKEDIALLHDLMKNNRTLIEIKRIAPSEYFIRSPKDM